MSETTPVYRAGPQQEHAELARIVRAALSQGGPFFFTWIDAATSEVKYCVYQAAPAWVIPGVDAYMRLVLGSPHPGTPTAAISSRPPVPQDGRI